MGGELLFILCIALFPYYGDSSGAILGVRSIALLHGGIAEGIREVKETAILRIVLFNNYNNRIPHEEMRLDILFALTRNLRALGA